VATAVAQLALGVLGRRGALLAPRGPAPVDDDLDVRVVGVVGLQLLEELAASASGTTQ
jgi:hypothetical protein